MKRSRLFSATLLVLSSTIALSACGGGGGNTRSDPPPVQPPPTTPPPAPAPPPAPPAPPALPPAPAPTPAPAPPPAHDPNAPLPAPTAAYRTHLDPVNAPLAWSKGFTGKGEVIGVLDSGANELNPVLENKVVGAITMGDPTRDTAAPNDPKGHGTTVSQILVGNRVGLYQQGVAHGAEVFVTRSVNNAGNIVDSLGSVNALADTGVRLVNNSWNSIRALGDERPDSFNATYAAAFRRITQDNGGIMVFSTGNDSRLEPGMYASFPHLYHDLEKGWLAVAALTPDGQRIAGYSNHCGDAAQWCLSAPGAVITMHSQSKQGDSTYRYISSTGTSFSAPIVTAGAALVWEAFPWMNNDQVRKTLMGTATDLGEPGVDSVYGHGLVNIGKAVDGFGRINWGTENLQVEGTSTFANDISGAGGIDKQGSGLLKLAGRNTYQGGTRVSGGMLSITGSTASNVEVAQGGTLGATGLIQGNVANAGTLAVEDGDFNIQGNLSQSANGQTRIQLGSRLFVSDTFSVDGKLNIGSVAPGYVSSSRETLVQAGNIDGTFSSFDVAPSLFLNGTLDYSDARIDVNLNQVAATSIASLNATPMSVENAKQVDTAFGLSNRIASQTSKTSEDLAYLDAMGRLQGAQTSETALAAIDGISGQGRLLSTAGLMDQMRHQSRATDTRLHAVQSLEDGVWAAGSEQATSWNPSGWAGIRTRGSDWSGGVDRTFDQWTLGAYGTTGVANIDADRGLANDRIATKGAGVYAARDFDGVRVSGRIQSTSGDLRGQRSVSIAGQSPTVFRQEDISDFSVRMGASGKMTDQWRWFADAGYQKLTLDGSSDQGGDGLGITTGKSSFERMDGEIGARGEWAFEQSPWLANANVSFAHDFSRDPLQMNAAYLIDPSERFLLQGPGMDRTRLLYGAGFDFKGKQWSGFVRGDGMWSSHSRGWGIGIGVKTHW